MPNMAETPDPLSFFSRPANPRHRRYEILRAFFLDQLPAHDVARRFDCSRAAVYSIVRDFRLLADPAAFFFRSPDPPGRPLPTPSSDLHDEIVRLRKLNLSVPDIKARLDASSAHPPSERAIRNALVAEGFARLPRRSRALRAAAGPAPERAPESAPLAPRSAELFQSERAAGILCFLPLIRRYPERLDTESGRKELADLAAQYYRTTHDAIRRYDPHHLILGDRYEANAPIATEVIDATKPFVDVLSFQDFRNPLAHLDEWHTRTGKPVLLADAPGVRRPASPDNFVSNDGKWYAEVLEGLFENLGCIGFHLCGAYQRNKARQRGLLDEFEQPRHSKRCPDRSRKPPRDPPNERTLLRPYRQRKDRDRSRGLGTWQSATRCSRVQAWCEL